MLVPMGSKSCLSICRDKGSTVRSNAQLGLDLFFLYLENFFLFPISTFGIKFVSELPLFPHFDLCVQRVQGCPQRKKGPLRRVQFGSLVPGLSPSDVQECPASRWRGPWS
jgi:hypothetical protein